MRPYKRKYHSTWRTRKAKGTFGEIVDYLKPFVQCTKVIWKLKPPFPLTAKIFITTFTWILLVLPLCYFFVPPLVTLLLLNTNDRRIHPNLTALITNASDKFKEMCSFMRDSANSTMEKLRCLWMSPPTNRKRKLESE